MFLRLSRNAGLARGPYGAAGTPDWLEGGLVRMRRTGPEPADAYGHPTGGTYTLGVGTAVAGAHDPSTHGLPRDRSGQEARARLVRVLATTFRHSRI